MSIFDSRKLEYNAMSMGTKALTGLTTRFALKKGWKVLTKHDPPLNPASPKVLWRDALIWGAVSGMIVGIARVITRRISTGWWRKYKGAKPVDL